MHSLWAIAKNTLSQAIRMKVAVAVVVLLVILLPLMSVVMEGDGTLLGKLQTFVSYGLGLVSLLLCILTIAISTFALSNDLKRKHLFLVVTKPVHRYEVVAGKLLGVCILNVFLILIFGAIIYGLTLAIPFMVDADPMQHERVKAEFFTARTGLKVTYDEDEMRKLAEQQFTLLKQTDQLPRDMDQNQALSELVAQQRMIAKSCPPGKKKQWDFDGVRFATAEDPNTLIFVRYKFQATTMVPDDKIYGLWRIGDLRQLEKGTERLVTPIVYADRNETIRVYHEFAVPASVVAPDGFLAVEFFNSPSLNAATVVLEEVEVLFHSGTFTGNYMRALLMIYVRLTFLAALGISLTTWLSFPVAILVCLVAFLAGTANSFIVDSFDGLGMAMGLLYTFTLRPLLWMIPQFDGNYNPSSYIINGRLIEWPFLSMTIITTLLIKAMVILLFGMWIFSRREIAKAVV